MKILLVEWVDSCGNTGWHQTDECKAELMYCQSVGFLVDATKEAICIALSRTTTKGCNPFGDLITIPRCAIKRIKTLAKGN